METRSRRSFKTGHIHHDTPSLLKFLGVIIDGIYQGDYRNHEPEGWEETRDDDSKDNILLTLSGDQALKQYLEREDPLIEVIRQNSCTSSYWERTSKSRKEFEETERSEIVDQSSSSEASTLSFSTTEKHRDNDTCAEATQESSTREPPSISYGLTFAHSTERSRSDAPRMVTSERSSRVVSQRSRSNTSAMVTSQRSSRVSSQPNKAGVGSPLPGKKDKNERKVIARSMERARSDTSRKVASVRLPEPSQVACQSNKAAVSSPLPGKKDKKESKILGRNMVRVRSDASRKVASVRLPASSHVASEPKNTGAVSPLRGKKDKKGSGKFSHSRERTTRNAPRKGAPARLPARSRVSSQTQTPDKKDKSSSARRYVGRLTKGGASINPNTFVTKKSLAGSRTTKTDRSVGANTIGSGMSFRYGQKRSKKLVTRYPMPMASIQETD